MTQVKPDYNSNKTKKEQVSEMFDSISYRYDFLNHFFSLNMDKCWRKRAVKELKRYSPASILDVATGTGDFAVALSALRPKNITGIDISEKMLKIGKQKIRDKYLDSLISLQPGDAENIPFGDSSFDAVTVAFGVRNFENLQRGLNEIYRVVKPGGAFAILEFSKPRNILIKVLYYFYFKIIMPFAGRIISGNNRAYGYLPESVMAFPEREVFLEHLRKAGFEKNRFIPLSLGIVMLYLSEK
jgi:demethylmenaquinone methyltransferase / 2-methoxy-6-polyprenyl-1,4-benzoquinol methylase